MSTVRLHPEVADALAHGRAVVALESTIISHGLPRPDNLAVARDIESAVRSAGAVPATVAVVDGVARVGLDDAALARIATVDTVVKASVRDLAVVGVRGADAATTVAATAHLAAQAGITVFATGGLGGVHREARDSWDESADLVALSRTPVLVVCSGVKSILDVPATLERLESLSVAVLGYRTDSFPGFYLVDSGHRVDWRVESADEVARILAQRRRLGVDGYGMLLANPVPVADELAPDLHEQALRSGLSAARERSVRGKDVTPFLLDHFHHRTGGASLRTNVALVLANAALAAEVAVAYAARTAADATPGVTVVCLGDVMVDVLARLSGPLAVRSDTPSSISLRPGGSAANTAAWLAELGVPVVLAARTGDDVLGRLCADDLARRGIGLALQPDADRPTGTCIVLIGPDGERTMVPDAGANASFAEDGVPDLRGARWLHVSGYLLLRDRSRPAAVAALGRARAAGIPASVDAASAAPLAQAGLRRFLGWIGPGVLLVTNSDEAATLTSAPDDLAAAEALSRATGRCVVKTGPRGAIWAEAGRAVQVPTTAVTAVDSTGAGDAFAAGLIAGLLAGDAPRVAVAAGNRLAGRAVQIVGGRPPVPTGPER